MPDKSVSTAARPPKGKAEPGKGKKVLGMDRKVAVIGGLALAGGVLFILWRNHQAAASGSTADTTGTAADGGAAGPADTSGVQGGAMQGATGTETLVIKIKELQGSPKRKPKPVAHPIGRVDGPKPRRRRRRRRRGQMTPPHIVAGRA